MKPTSIPRNFARHGSWIFGRKTTSWLPDVILPQDPRNLQDDRTPGMTELNQSKARGFTLIELLVVIAIIGLLSSVVLTSLSTARAKSRDAKRIASLQQMRTALNMCMDKVGSYAIETETTLRAPCFREPLNDGDFINSWKTKCGEFMSVLPTDPSTQDTADGQFMILTSADNSHYALLAKLEQSTNPNISSPAAIASTLTGVNITGITACPGYNYIIAE
jgi:prepilin-type N-terminal cleavage/methylation domain-containing protein